MKLTNSPKGFYEYYEAKDCFVCLGFMSLLASLTYLYRYPTGDDAWLGEQAFWLAKQGVIKSEFFRGLLGCEDQIFVSHKLFVLFGSWMIHIFGYKLPVLQFVGLLSFIVLIIQISIYVLKKCDYLKVRYLLAVLILVFSNRLLIKMSFEYRPEMTVAVFGFGSFLCLLRGKLSRPWVALSGIFAGLAFLCHLNGVVFLIAGFVTLLRLREYRLLSWYSVVGGVTAATYFSDVLLLEDGFSIWYKQFAGDPITQNSMNWKVKLSQMVSYPAFFFKTFEQAALSLLLVFLLWKRRFTLSKLPVRQRIYALTLFISFWLITKSNNGTYVLIFIPFMLVIILELYKIEPFWNNSLKLVLVSYFVIGIFGMCQIIYTNLTMEYLPVSYQKLRSKIGVGKTGLVPLTFFFDEYENYPRLLTNENYELQLGKNCTTTESMARWAYRNKVGFILMDHKFRPKSYYPKSGTKLIPHYKLTFFDGRFSVYQR